MKVILEMPKPTDFTQIVKVSILFHKGIMHNSISIGSEMIFLYISSRKGETSAQELLNIDIPKAFDYQQYIRFIQLKLANLKNNSEYAKAPDKCILKALIEINKEKEKYEFRQAA